MLSRVIRDLSTVKHGRGGGRCQVPLLGFESSYVKSVLAKKAKIHLTDLDMEASSINACCSHIRPMDPTSSSHEVPSNFNDSRSAFTTVNWSTSLRYVRWLVNILRKERAKTQSCSRTGFSHSLTYLFRRSNKRRSTDSGDKDEFDADWEVASEDFKEISITRGEAAGELKTLSTISMTSTFPPKTRVTRSKSPAGCGSLKHSIFASLPQSSTFSTNQVGKAFFERGMSSPYNPTFLSLSALTRPCVSCSVYKTLMRSRDGFMVHLNSPETKHLFRSCVASIVRSSSHLEDL